MKSIQESDDWAAAAYNTAGDIVTSGTGDHDFAVRMAQYYRSIGYPSAKIFQFGGPWEAELERVAEERRNNIAFMTMEGACRYDNHSRWKEN